LSKRQFLNFTSAEIAPYVLLQSMEKAFKLAIVDLKWRSAAPMTKRSLLQGHPWRIQALDSRHGLASSQKGFL
jgi:hypothetical protein